MRSFRALSIAAATTLIFTLAIVAPSAANPRPLTTLDFTEVPRQPVDGLSLQGVSFAFSIGGVPSTDANYNSGGPGNITYVQDPSLEGNAKGTLTITFARPTWFVQFGVALSTFATLPAGATVNVIGPTGKLRGVFTVATSPLVTFTEGQFTYDHSRTKQLVITFDSSAALRFALDNLTYQQVPQ